MDSLSISSAQLSVLIFVSIAFSITALVVALSAVICIWGLHSRKREPGESRARDNSAPVVAPYVRTYTAYQPAGDSKPLQSAAFEPRKNAALGLDGAVSTPQGTSQSSRQGRPDELFWGR